MHVANLMVLSDVMVSHRTYSCIMILINTTTIEHFVNFVFRVFQTKHVDSYAQEKDDPRHSKMLSEIYLTRLLSTKV